MSDSIDRVFAHALQTVRKIPRASSTSASNSNVAHRPSSPSAATPRRPPTEDRLRLYGLYKQSMEGDVLGVMERPTGKTEADKWDAWRAVGGMRKTEAKRRYIECLIETMKKYASDTPEACELVSELEFVWDQVKNNSTNSRGHSASQSLASITFPSTTTIPSIQGSYRQGHSSSAPPLLQQPQRQQPQLLQLQMHYPSPTVRYNSPPPSPTSAPVTRYRQEPSRPPDYLLEQGYQSSGEYEHLITPGQAYYENSHPGGAAKDGQSRPQLQQQGQGRYVPLQRMKVGSRGTRSIQSQSGGEEEEEEEEEEVTEQETGDDEEEGDDDEEDELFNDKTLNNKGEPSITRLPHHHLFQHDDQDQDADDYDHLDDTGFRPPLVMGRDTSPDMGTTRWQLRVERALTKMSAEITALREQLEVRNAHVLQSSGSWFWPGTESNRSSVVRRKGGGGVGVGVGDMGGRKWARVLWQVVWNVCRHLMVDAVVVGIVIWWIGRRGGEKRAGEVWRWIVRGLGRRRREGGAGGGEGTVVGGMGGCN
ncbi:acyl CoA binding protein-domain-containing protein [Tirmania nivea]|nr:acyl CoA binding protein-domain-containing protein [Tirmania nivea]